MNEICEHCDNDIEYNIYTDKQRFCSDQCRIDYHNTRRKVSRKIATIHKNLKELMDMLEDQTMAGHHVDIYKEMRGVKIFALGNSIRNIWLRCSDCRYEYWADPNDDCPHCQSRNVLEVNVKRFKS